MTVLSSVTKKKKEILARSLHQVVTSDTLLELHLQYQTQHLETLPFMWLGSRVQLRGRF